MLVALAQLLFFEQDSCVTASSDRFVTAMPPDVRRWLCPAGQFAIRFWGYAPGAQPQLLEGST